MGFNPGFKGLIEMYRCSIYCQIVSYRTRTLEMCLSTEELPTDQPQYTGEFAQYIDDSIDNI